MLTKLAPAKKHFKKFQEKESTNSINENKMNIQAKCFKTDGLFSKGNENKWRRILKSF